jgi:hypothetical protein
MRNKLEQNYSKIWEKYTDTSFQEVLSRGTAFHHDEDEQGSDILYVGINPSFSDGSKKESFVFNREAPHPYFEPFKKIKAELEKEPYSLQNIKWTHLDILVFRETNQKYIETLLQEGKGVPFVYEQVMVAKERILHIQPKVIVVCNTKARELMGKNRFKPENVEELGVWMDFEFKFDMDFGTYRITNVPELEHTHVLFSSMLSGKRALDLGSRERMVWQIGRVLKIDNSK